MTSRWLIITTWTAARWGIGAAAAVLSAAALVFANGAVDGAALPGAAWTGAIGLLLATTRSRSGLLVQMFAGLPLDAIRWGVQPAVGVAAVVLLGGALSARLKLEGDTLADPAAAQACATFVPIRPWPTV